jgi:mannose-6-phosphate isomerase-like protein (cupin superfamily)
MSVPPIRQDLERLMPDSRVLNLRDMTKGWFIGPFMPTALSTDQFECAVKRYQTGEKEGRHVHRVATEYTVIVSGEVRMNGMVYGVDAVIEIPPGQSTDFEALSDTVTVVVKVPAVPGDKYEC